MSSHSLLRGQRIKLAQMTQSKQFMVAIKATSPNLQFDISCFGLDEAGKLSDDRFFVFYNQPACPGDAIKLLGARNGDSQTFGVNLEKLPSTVRRLMWVISIDGNGEMNRLDASYLRLMVGGQEVARFPFSGRDLGQERALMVAELYFKDEWRVNAIAQGFAGGLDAVLKHFGGEIADATPTPPVPPLPNRTPAQSPAPAPVPPQRQIDGKNCVSCGKPISFWEKTMGRYKPISGRCGSCEENINRARSAALAEAQNAFTMLCHQPTFNMGSWQEAKRRAWNAGVPHSDLLIAIRTNALLLLQNLVERSAADGIITTDEDRQWRATLQSLDLPAEWTAPLNQRWEQEKALSSIRLGNLPTVRADFHMGSDEICHLLVNANFRKETKTKVEYVPVRLAATNKKLYVIRSGSGGKEISYAKVMRILPSQSSVTLELSSSSGAGTYFVEDPHYVDAVMTTLVKISKRQLVREQEASRTIPHSVRNAIWQRDGGKCVQCGASGRGACLEYDHIIPFSQGGASTEGNLRLLCRRCNLDKGGRI